MEKVLVYVTGGFLPIMCALIIAYAAIKRVPVYDCFIEGAKNGLKVAVEILPFMVGIYMAINCLTSSGLLSCIFRLARPPFEALSVPVELLPLMLLRAISGSGSFLLVSDIMEGFHPDSYIGRCACVMSGGCETVIYVIALYFSVTSVKNLRHAFFAGMAAYICGMVFALLICKVM